MRAVIALGAAALFACSDQVPTWNQDVQPIVARSCAGCHVERGIAPFTLQSFGDAVARKDLIRAQVEARTMPPWPPAAGCSEYAGDRSLPEGDRQTVLSWIDHGAVEGPPADAPATAAGPIGLSRVDRELRVAAPYQPVRAPDEYRCFLLDWPESQRRFVTGFSAEPGNAAIVHHVLAFVATPDRAAQFQALDDADPAPGYTCFGGPGGTANALGGWVPGTQGGDFPPGTGVPIDPGSKIILQVHYNLTNSLNPFDQTAIRLKLDAAVAKQAFLLPWADPTWLNSGTMDIPAGAADVRHSFTLAPGPYLGLITGNQLSAGRFTVYSAALHQHLRGTSSRLEIQRAGGARECLLDIPHWNFHWQGGYTLKTPKVVERADILSIECHWNNSAANQPDGLPPRDLNWGEGTSDEMCLGFLYITQ